MQTKMRKRGRPPFFGKPMTSLERWRRWKDRQAALPTPEWRRGLLMLEVPLSLDEELARLRDDPKKDIEENRPHRGNNSRGGAMVSTLRTGEGRRAAR
jgi:hypothetical protein